MHPPLLDTARHRALSNAKRRTPVLAVQPGALRRNVTPMMFESRR
jgi:hypothetical protein